MKRWIRRGIVAVVSLAVLAAAAVAVATQWAVHKMNRQVDVSVAAVAPARDAAAVERGRYLYASRGCADCHGPTAAGACSSTTARACKLAAPQHQPRRRQRHCRLPRRRLGAKHPPRRQARRPADHDHAQRGLQPLHRRRPRGPRRLRPADAGRARPARGDRSCRCRHAHSTASARSRTLPRRSTTACHRRPGGRGRERRTRPLRCQHVPRLPRRRRWPAARCPAARPTGRPPRASRPATAA